MKPEFSRSAAYDTIRKLWTKDTNKHKTQRTKEEEDLLGVSLLDLAEDFHDQIRGINVSLDRIGNTLDAILDAKVNKP